MLQTIEMKFLELKATTVASSEVFHSGYNLEKGE